MGRMDGAPVVGAAHDTRLTGDQELKGSGYELCLLLMSILSVSNTVIVVLPVADQVRDVALLIDLLIVPVFLFDFLYRLRTTRPRTLYLVRRFGWADFLAIAPFLGIFRLFRIGRVTHLLRERGARRILADLDRQRAAVTFSLTLILVVVVVEFAGMGVFLAESTARGGNIQSAGDAVWWGFVTVTTVGYGDRFPTTVTGRLIGVLLLFAGVALFSVLTGFIANVFLEPRRRVVAEVLADGVAPSSIAADVRELRRLLDEQAAGANVIRDRIDEIERKAAQLAGPPAG